MTHDPEAAWPLTETDQGYFPGPMTAPTPPPAPLVPYTPGKMQTPSIIGPDQPTKPMSHGARIAFLAIILGAAIPLTAISASYADFFGVIVAWMGIVLVAAIAFGFGFRRG